MTALGALAATAELEAAIVPAGVIAAFPGGVPSTVTAGGVLLWLPCDGAAVSRATYATLWNTVGGAYGSGNGTSTFNVPNLVGRIPRGAAAGAAVNGSGGSLDHVHAAGTLAIASHSHAAGSLQAGVGHIHTIPWPSQTHSHAYNSAVANLYGGDYGAILNPPSTPNTDAATPSVLGAMGGPTATQVANSTNPTSKTLTGNTDPANPPVQVVAWGIKT